MGWCRPQRFLTWAMRLLAAAAVGTLACVSAPAQAQGTVKSVHNDWQVRCDSPPGAHSEQCALIQSVTAEGDRVVVEFEGNATLVNGESYCNEYCMVFTLSDGKIKQVNEYFCTILADKVLFPLVAAEGL